jgi:hypothetical protein
MEKPGLGPKKQHPEETSSGHPSDLENNNAGDSRKISVSVLARTGRKKKLMPIKRLHHR